MDARALVGERVELRGLQKRPDLNGRIGRAVSYDEAAGRIGVRLSATEQVLVRMENVTLSGTHTGGPTEHRGAQYAEYAQMARVIGLENPHLMMVIGRSTPPAPADCPPLFEPPAEEAYVQPAISEILSRLRGGGQAVRDELALFLSKLARCPASGPSDQLRALVEVAHLSSLMQHARLAAQCTALPLLEVYTALIEAGLVETLAALLLAPVPAHLSAHPQLPALQYHVASTLGLLCDTQPTVIRGRPAQRSRFAGIERTPALVAAHAERIAASGAMPKLLTLAVPRPLTEPTAAAPAGAAPAGAPADAAAPQLAAAPAPAPAEAEGAVPDGGYLASVKAIWALRALCEASPIAAKAVIFGRDGGLHPAFSRSDLLSTADPEYWQRRAAAELEREGGVPAHTRALLGVGVQGSTQRLEDVDPRMLTDVDMDTRLRERASGAHENSVAVLTALVRAVPRLGAAAIRHGSLMRGLLLPTMLDPLVNEGDIVDRMWQETGRALTPATFDGDGAGVHTRGAILLRALCAHEPCAATLSHTTADLEGAMAVKLFLPGAWPLDEWVGLLRELCERDLELTRREGPPPPFAAELAAARAAAPAAAAAGRTADAPRALSFMLADERLQFALCSLAHHVCTNATLLSIAASSALRALTACLSARDPTDASGLLAALVRAGLDRSLTRGIIEWGPEEGPDGAGSDSSVHRDGFEIVRAELEAVEATMHESARASAFESSRTYACALGDRDEAGARALAERAQAVADGGEHARARQMFADALRKVFPGEPAAADVLMLRATAFSAHFPSDESEGPAEDDEPSVLALTHAIALRCDMWFDPEEFAALALMRGYAFARLGPDFVGAARSDAAVCMAFNPKDKKTVALLSALQQIEEAAGPSSEFGP